jgi:hypothetical protein
VATGLSYHEINIEDLSREFTALMTEAASVPRDMRVHFERIKSRVKLDDDDDDEDGAQRLAAIVTRHEALLKEVGDHLMAPVKALSKRLKEISSRLNEISMDVNTLRTKERTMSNNVMNHMRLNRAFNPNTSWGLGIPGPRASEAVAVPAAASNEEELEEEKKKDADEDDNSSSSSSSSSSSKKKKKKNNKKKNKATDLAKTSTTITPVAKSAVFPSQTLLVNAVTRQ